MRLDLMRLFPIHREELMRLHSSKQIMSNSVSHQFLRREDVLQSYAACCTTGISILTILIYCTPIRREMKTGDLMIPLWVYDR
jgi:hypothetical protein